MFCRYLSLLMLFFSSILTADQSFQWTAVTDSQIEHWIEQFQNEDQLSARKLLSHINYYGPDQVKSSLRSLHHQVVTHLKNDGFDLEGEDPFAQVDFSKLYCAKSGDLLSYFYRQVNGLRAFSFRNLGDLSHDQTCKEQRALVIIEDYVGTGTQFLWWNYAKAHHPLFNQYRKVYLICMVANQTAIERFSQIKSKNYVDFALFLEKMSVAVNDPVPLNTIEETLHSIDSDKVELIYDSQEIPLFDRVDISTADKNLFRDLMHKYAPNIHLNGVFASSGYSIFFYNCPNNIPDIFWNRKCALGWIPLFYRYEDASVYDCGRALPIAEQTW